MKNSNNRINPGKWIKALLLAAVIFASPFVTKAQNTPKVKNIILVHGAFADGSGWEGVFKLLTAKGYNVTVLQQPLTSLKDDVAALNHIIDKQDGPVVLVGHSYGGFIITEAGINPKVASLVYVAAFEPEAGETLVSLSETVPASPENGIMPPDEKGFLYYSKEKFHAGFCADLPKDKADFMYASQGSISIACFTTPITNVAWKVKPAFTVISAEDKSIVPELQRNMVKRSGAKATEVKGSHVVFISHPKEVAAVIESATK